MLKNYYHLLVEQGGVPGVYERCATGEWNWMKENLAGLHAAKEHAPDTGVSNVSDGVARDVGGEAEEDLSNDTSNLHSDSDTEEE